MSVGPSVTLASASDRSVQPGSFRAWTMACRPATLPAAVAPVAVGTACAFASDGARLGPALAAAAGALLLQVAANLGNDVFDHEKGADTAQRVGPTRAVQSGLLTAAAVRRAMVAVLALAVVVGSYLTWVAGWPVVVMGLLAMASAVAYTGGPYPLGYHGLGELFVMVFFGFVAVGGTAYVQVLFVPPLAWWGALAVGSLISSLLVVNNLRDRETDARVGKRTLAVRLGRRGAIAEYAALVGVAYAVPVLLVALDHASVWGLLPLVTLPLASRLVVRVSRDTGRDLNTSLVGTARLVLVHGLLLAGGILLGSAGT